MLELIDDAGNKRTFAHIKNIKKATKQGIKNAFRKSGQGLIRSFKAEVKFGFKSGRMYGKHQASAPFETPANKTGSYYREISESHNTRELTFGNRVKYAGYLERGTTKMEPRPGLLYAIEDQKDHIIRHFNREIIESIGHS